MEFLERVLSFELLSLGKYSIAIWQVITMIVILLLARGVNWLLNAYLSRKVNKGSLDEGKKYAIYQISHYVIYVIAITLGLDFLGVRITVLLAGSTALLVGLGLGLQDFFRDLVAGFIILSERTVTASDVVEVNGTIGRVHEVGLRTTTLITRDDIVLIIPNTRLTNDNVINWSQNRKSSRFNISISVAYGSDTALVSDLLLQAAKKHPQVKKRPEPYVFFKNFGDNGLEFLLLFHSDNLFRIERVKSELRFEIDSLFRAHNINIPYPQRTLHINPSDIPWPTTPTKD
jgi:small-conductance mechanosensitive channel